MSRDKAGSVANAPDRQIAFRAPDIVHGGLKEIIGRLERISYRVDGKPTSGQDILNWLVGELYMEGPEKWPKRIAEAHKKFVEFAEQN